MPERVQIYIASASVREFFEEDEVPFVIIDWFLSSFLEPEAIVSLLVDSHGQAHGPYRYSSKRS